MTTTEATATQEQPGMKTPEPQKEHAWLKRLVGEWTFEGEAMMGPDAPPSTFKGVERVRSLGELWILCEGEGEMPEGGVAKTVMTLGYDPQKKRFVGTFVGSMMTNLWIYDGALDASEKVLALDSEGPAMAGDGSIGKYKDTIELKSDDHRVMTSQAQGADGKWTQLMTMTFRRTK
jgi:hypothetical protein